MTKKTKIEMLATTHEGKYGTMGQGDVYEVEPEDAKRMIEAGNARVPPARRKKAAAKK